MRPTSPLRSLITDDLGRRYEPVHTTKDGRRYRYYVSHKEDEQGQDRKQGRLPAEALEQQVADRLASYLRSPDELLDTLPTADDTAADRDTFWVVLADPSSGTTARRPIGISIARC